MLQYRLKYEAVQTQMPNWNINFLFNIFSFLSIFNSTFSLSNPCSLSLSFSNHPPSPSNQRYSGLINQAADHRSSRPHRSIRCPHRSSCRHRFSFEDSIATDLKTPLSPVWSRHIHLSLKLPFRLNLNPSQSQLEAVTPLIWCASLPQWQADLSHYRRSKATIADKEIHHCRISLPFLPICFCF